jgi:signal transduction histidine kinase
VFLPHAFERFRQHDGSKARESGGLGLGLSIVRDLVDLHRGTVEADSAGIGQGARFTVRFPRHESRANPGESGTDGAAAASGMAGAI